MPPISAICRSAGGQPCVNGDLETSTLAKAPVVRRAGRPAHAWPPRLAAVLLANNGARGRSAMDGDVGRVRRAAPGSSRRAKTRSVNAAGARGLLRAALAVEAGPTQPRVIDPAIFFSLDSTTAGWAWWQHCMYIVVSARHVAPRSSPSRAGGEGTRPPAPAGYQPSSLSARVRKAPPRPARI